MPVPYTKEDIILGDFPLDHQDVKSWASGFVTPDGRVIVASRKTGLHHEDLVRKFPALFGVSKDDLYTRDTIKELAGRGFVWFSCFQDVGDSTGGDASKWKFSPVTEWTRQVTPALRDRVNRLVWGTGAPQWGDATVESRLSGLARLLVEASFHIHAGSILTLTVVDKRYADHGFYSWRSGDVFQVGNKELGEMNFIFMRRLTKRADDHGVGVDGAWCTHGEVHHNFRLATREEVQWAARQTLS